MFIRQKINIFESQKKTAMTQIEKFLELEILRIGKYSLNLSNIVSIVIIFLATLIVLWLLKKFMFRKRHNKIIEKGNIHSLFQIIKYLVWIISILFVMEAADIKLNVLLAGSAALLVGIGLGLQSTFNNFISGVILLFEGSIKVGDILEVDGDVVKTIKIELRTTTAIN